jgi:hypothetical protein
MYSICPSLRRRPFIYRALQKQEVIFSFFNSNHPAGPLFIAITSNHSTNYYGICLPTLFFDPSDFWGYVKGLRFTG